MRILPKQGNGLCAFSAGSNVPRADAYRVANEMLNGFAAREQFDPSAMLAAVEAGRISVLTSRSTGVRYGVKVFAEGATPQHIRAVLLGVERETMPPHLQSEWLLQRNPHDGTVVVVRGWDK